MLQRIPLRCNAYRCVVRVAAMLVLHVCQVPLGAILEDYHISHAWALSTAATPTVLKYPPYADALALPVSTPPTVCIV